MAARRRQEMLDRRATWATMKRLTPKRLPVLRPRISRHSTGQVNSVGGLAVETTKQITVFLENKPGRLANVLSALAREKVNITALSVMDKHEHSVLRLVSDDPARTAQVMQSLNT